MDTETPQETPQLVRFGPLSHQVLHVRLVEELLMHMRAKQPKQFGDCLRDVIISQNGHQG